MMNKREAGLFCDRLIANNKHLTAEHISFKEGERLVVITYKEHMFSYSKGELSAIMYTDCSEKDRVVADSYLSNVMSYIRKAEIVNELRW